MITAMALSVFCAVALSGSMVYAGLTIARRDEQSRKAYIRIERTIPGLKR